MPRPTTRSMAAARDASPMRQRRPSLSESPFRTARAKARAKTRTKAAATSATNKTSNQRKKEREAKTIHKRQEKDKHKEKDKDKHRDAYDAEKQDTVAPLRSTAMSSWPLPRDLVTPHSSLPLPPSLRHWTPLRAVTPAATPHDTKRGKPATTTKHAKTHATPNADTQAKHIKAACERVSATLAKSLDAESLLFFRVRLRDGRDVVYTTRLTRDLEDDGGVTLRMGIPTAPDAAYPAGRAAECVELSLGPRGCALEYIQTHAKYFLPRHLDDPMAGTPLTQCTQPRMEEGAAPWGRVWLEVTRQLCDRLGLRALDLQDESSFTSASGQLVSLARVKLLTSGVTWYERELHATPAEADAAAWYRKGQAALPRLTVRSLRSAALAGALALADASITLDTPLSTATSRLLAADAAAPARVRAALASVGLDRADACEHGTTRTALSTLLGRMLDAARVQDPYALVWRMDVRTAPPVVEGVRVLGYVPLPRRAAALASLLAAA